MLKRTFESMDPRLWKDLQVLLAWLHLEYIVQAQNLRLQEIINKIERVQSMAYRTPTGFEKLEYEKRLKNSS